MGRSMGRGLREFKDSVTGGNDDDKFAIPDLPGDEPAVELPAARKEERAA